MPSPARPWLGLLLLCLLGTGHGVPQAEPAERARPVPRAFRGAPATLAIDMSAGVPVVEATIGDIPLRLVVDTGAGWCVLTPGAADRARLVRRSPEDLKAHDAAGEEQTVAVARVEHLALPAAGDRAVELGDFDVIVLDSPVVKRARADGILGLPLLARAVVRFDFAAGTLQVGAPPLADPEAPGVLPLKPAGNGQFGVAVRFDRKADPATPTTRGSAERDVPSILLLDTGFSGTLHLPKRAADALSTGSSSEGAEGTSATALRERRVQAVPLTADLLIGPHRIHQPTASVFPGDTGGPGAIGCGVLKAFSLTIDVPRRRVRLEGSAYVISSPTTRPNG